MFSYALKCGYESTSSSWILLRVVYTLLGCFYNILDAKKTAVSIVWQCNLMCMQFVLLKPLLAVLPFILENFLLIDYYNLPLLSDNYYFNLYNPRLYIVIIQNISVAIAFYGITLYNLYDMYNIYMM